jgi:hypothetical protein
MIQLAKNNVTTVNQAISSHRLIKKHAIVKISKILIINFIEKLKSSP